MLWRYLLLIICGSANALAFAPFTLWWLPLLTVAVLVFLLLHAASTKKALALGFSYGIGWFGVGISWVHVSIDQFGGLPLFASLGLMALLVCYLAVFPALACYSSYKLRHPAIMPLIFASSWVIAEALRGVVFTGFPWLSLGYSQTSNGLTAMAPLIGETGIQFVLVFSAAALAQLLSKQPPLLRYGYIVIAGAVFAVSPQLTRWHGWQHSGESLSVLLVQGNIKQELRWAPEQEWPTMLKYMDLTRPHFETDLIIWPEAAVPQLEPLAKKYLENLDQTALYQNTAVITGIIDYRFDTQQAWNNLIVLGKRAADSADGDYFYGHSNRYSKHHLLPIGEFVPFEQWLRRLAPIFDLPMSSFSRGNYVQPNLLANGYQILPAVCFEIAFPAQIAANFSEQTQLLLTVSNDAWFGDSIGPHQHLQIAQMRALEFGRPLLRATNNGITAVVDANGNIQQQAPQFTQAVLRDTVQLTTGTTPYSRFGNIPLFIFCSGLLLAQLSLQLFSLYRRRISHPS